MLFARRKTMEKGMYVNPRALNTNTRLDLFPPPRIAGLLGRLDKARYFGSIDLVSAYY